MQSRGSIVSKLEKLKDCRLIVSYAARPGVATSTQYPEHKEILPGTSTLCDPFLATMARLSRVFCGHISVSVPECGLGIPTCVTGFSI